MNIRLELKDGNVKIVKAVMKQSANKVEYIMSEEHWHEAKELDFLFDLFEAKDGDDGYFLMPMQRTNNHGFLTYFKAHEGEEFIGTG